MIESFVDSIIFFAPQSEIQILNFSIVIFGKPITCTWLFNVLVYVKMS